MNVRTPRLKIETWGARTGSGVSLRLAAGEAAAQGTGSAEDGAAEKREAGRLGCGGHGERAECGSVIP